MALVSAAVQNVPTQVTTFIGRKRELTEARRLISTHRLVTLTGVGGVGKTRLALQVVGRLRRACPEGTVLVELADARDPELLVHTVADAVGMRDLPKHDPDVALCRHEAHPAGSGQLRVSPGRLPGVVHKAAATLPEPAHCRHQSGTAGHRRGAGVDSCPAVCSRTPHGGHRSGSWPVRGNQPVRRSGVYHSPGTCWPLTGPR